MCKKSLKIEQTPHGQKEKVQMDKQRSTKHTHKAKYRVTRTPLKIGSELIVLIFSCPQFQLQKLH